jgi:hypothetical protein
VNRVRRPSPFDQRAPGDLLKSPDMLAHSGLPQVQRGRGPAKSAGVREGEKATQRSDVKYPRHLSAYAH